MATVVVQTLKKLLILLGIAAVLAWLRQSSKLPAPETPHTPVPGFRSHTHTTSETSPSRISDAPGDQPPSGEPAADPMSETLADDLEEIKGIGPVFAERLRTMGITTFAALADCDVTTVAENVDVRPEMVDDWKDQARRR